jgi:uncharacterized spore protein YtfJ
MTSTEMLVKIGESVGSTATVRSVFGEPVHSEGKTVIPVAKVMYGFGGGGGSGSRGSGEEGAPNGEGSGGGGGACAWPAGVLEITATRTRFVPFLDLRLVAGVFGAGMLLGGLVWRRRSR